MRCCFELARDYLARSSLRTAHSIERACLKTIAGAQTSWLNLTRITKNNILKAITNKIMTLSTIAEKLNMPIEILEKESIKSFLNRELHLTEIELFNLSVKYGAKNIKDLQQKIKNGEIPETRNSVEDFFNFDHMEAKKDKLKKILQTL